MLTHDQLVLRRRRFGAHFERGRPLIWGHRGVRPQASKPENATVNPPENTMAAMRAALAAGADGIECDVRLTRDGEVVVLHDPDLARVTGGRDMRQVAALSAREVAAIDLGGGEPPPLLGEVLRFAAEHGLLVNVEMKRDLTVTDSPAGGTETRAGEGSAQAPVRRYGARAQTLARNLAVRAQATRALYAERLRLVRAVEAVIRDAGAALCMVSSFDPAMLAALYAIAPRVPLAFLCHAGQRRYLSWGHDLSWHLLSRLPLAAWHPEAPLVTPEMIARARAAGVMVNVWTVDDPAEARALIDLGVDGLITDVPEALYPLVHARHAGETIHAVARDDS